ncbi:hypothetical protein [Luteibacter rhizovicinus]|nr:hypothetical protein [Luteibacter rhizovicinus]
MKDHKDRRMTLAEASSVRVWPRARFRAEALAERLEQHHLPFPRSTLKVGDRVTFDLGEGVDGPLYATNVRLIDRG